MDINYLLSGTTKGATTLALKKVVKIAENDVFQDVLVLVPEPKSIIVEKELLNLSQNGAFANVYVYSFVRLISRLGLVSAEKILGKQTCIVLLKKIIYESMDELCAYKNSAKTSGFAEKIYDTIQQFKSSEITPSDLENVLSGSNIALNEKMKDILILYKKYEESLGTELFDDCDRLALLKKIAKNNDFIQNSVVFVVGFDGITNEMQSVLKEFAKYCKAIYFSCVYFNEKRQDKQIQNNNLYFKFKRIGDELKIPYNPVFQDAKLRGDFKHVAENLFALNPSIKNSEGQIKIFEAQNQTDEIEFVANMILREVRGGLRFRDIGVFVPNLETVSDEIKRTFSMFEIPFYINSSKEVTSHFYVQFLKNIFNVYSSHLETGDVLKIVSNPLFEAKNYPKFENFALSLGISYGDFKNSSIFDTLKDVDDEVKNDFYKFQNFYKEVEIKIKNAKNINDFLCVIKFVNNYFKIQEKLIKISAYEDSVGLFEQSQISSKIFEKLQEFALKFENFMGNTPCGVEEFLSVFFSGIETIKINLLPPTIDSVVVQGDTDGFYDIKCMFIIDAVQGRFPVKISDTGIILDSELEETKILVGKTPEPLVSETNEKENFKIYEALLEPKERLYICYPNKSLSGEVLKPARIILKLQNIFKNNILFNDYKKFELPTKQRLERDFAKNIGSFLDGEPDVGIVELNSSYAKAQLNLSEKFKNYVDDIFKAPDFELHEESKIELYKSKSSVSKLETYFSCPYKYFAEYSLRLKEKKNAKISSMDIGTLIHRVVELFVKNIESFKSLESSEFEIQVLQIVKSAMEEEQISEKRNKAIFEFIKSESVRICKYLLFEHENSSFKTAKNGTELIFAGKNAIDLNLDDGTKISIEGKIDRIDEYCDYIRIIDYKTGNISNDFPSIYFGKKIQLISYLIAISNFSDKKIAGLFYLPIHSDFSSSEKTNPYKFEGFLLKDIDVVKHMDNNLSFENYSSNLAPVKILHNEKAIKNNDYQLATSKYYLTAQEFENLKIYVKKLCEQALKEIISGNIEPSPIMDKNDRGVCSYCEYCGFCDLEFAKYSNGRDLSNFKIDIASFDD